MPRGIQLTSDQEAQVAILRQTGHSIRQIADTIGKSPNCIFNCIKRQELGVKITRSGRRSVVTDHDRRRIIREASNKQITSSKIKHNLGLQFSAKTIRKVIKQSGIIVYKKRQRKPVLSRDHRQRRVRRCERKLAWHTRFRRIVFSDEKKFNLDGPDGNCHYWHDIRKPELLHNKRHSGGGSVMIWAAIGYRGKTDIAFLEGKVNARKYQRTLEDHLLPHGARIGGEHWKFQQDNASVHTARSTIEWFNQHNIRTMQWPARSPDLNPIENMWAKLSSMVYEGGRQYDTKEELRLAIVEKWQQIGADYRRNLFDTMNHRIQAVIDARGMITHY